MRPNIDISYEEGGFVGRFKCGGREKAIRVPSKIQHVEVARQWIRYKIANL